MSNLEPTIPNLNRKNRRARVASLVSGLPGVLTGGFGAGIAAASFEAATAAPVAAEGMAHAEKSPPNLQQQLELTGELAGKITHRWLGVVDLHTPLNTYNGAIGFDSSPDSVWGGQGSADFQVGNFTKKPPKYSVSHKIFADPAIQKFRGQDYFVIYYSDPYEHNPFNFFWLNIKKAEKMGALTCYSYKTRKSGTVNYKITPTDLPGVNYDSSAYQPFYSGSVDKTHYVDKLYSVVLPSGQDSHAKTYKLQQTNCPSL